MVERRPFLAEGGRGSVAHDAALDGPPHVTRPLLHTVRFADRPAAERALERLDRVLPRGAVAERLEPVLAAALGEVADPDRALVTFERFVERHGSSECLLAELGHRPRVVETLVTVFAGSQFLAEILLRHPEDWRFLGELWRESRLDEVATGDGEPSTDDDGWEALRRRQQRALLRIGTADLLGLADLPSVTAALSRLADTVVRAALRLTAEGAAHDRELCVLALGKLGGTELNYSSDIDLVFFAEREPERHGRRVKHIVEGLARRGSEGFLYRVDLRLRPWGRDGDLVCSASGYLEYLERSARPSERQALLKGRPVAGDVALGRRLLEQARPLFLGSDEDELRRRIRMLKERIEGDLRRRGKEHLHVKAGPGSIRDVEFATQYLQLKSGREHPELLAPNTLDALSRLYDRGAIDADAFRVLAEGYVFLRTVEHYLQLMHYRQVHALPEGDAALTSLARRLRFRGDAAAERFRERYEQHTEAIRRIYRRLLDDGPRQSAPRDDGGELQGLPGMPPAYGEAFSAQEIARHSTLAGRLAPDHLVEVAIEPAPDDTHRVTIVGYELLGELSIICGLLFASGFNIVSGRVFTSQGATAAESTPSQTGSVPGVRDGRDETRHPSAGRTRRRNPGSGIESPREIIVDVFRVRHAGALEPEIWHRLVADLEDLLGRLHRGEREQAQGELAKRIALALPPPPVDRRTLYPIDITVDNERHPEHTVLHIEAPDTPGFLYELTNALALHDVSVKTMNVRTAGERVADTLWVTDVRGGKIEDEARQQELRVATVLTKHFTHLLPRSPNPESAQLHFRELLTDLFRRADWSSELASLERPEVLSNLARFLGVSDFLWTDFLRMQHANLFPILSDVEALASARDRAALGAELAEELAAARSVAERRQILNRFKDREMFRIDMRRILGHARSFEQFSLELTALGEVVFEAALELAMRELEPRYGTLDEGSPPPLCICALGKFGGRELGFASDFEVMFVYEGSGRTRGGEHAIDLPELCERLAETTCAAISALQEGIFEIDLRLRPYGDSGPLAVSRRAFAEYFGEQGDAWWYERQALIKLRPVAGAIDVGSRVAALRDEIVYSGRPPDVAASRAMRERQLRHLVTPGTVNAKYSPGGLVDLEYLVQLLQLRHGHGHERLRVTNTFEALHGMGELGLIGERDLAAAVEAYGFLRRLIDALRMVRGHARDLSVPTSDGDELAFLARRFGDTRARDRSVAALRRDLDLHLGRVRDLCERLL